MVTNDVNTVTVTANAGTDQAAVVAALQASEIVAVDIGGIYADLSLSASENVYAAYVDEICKVLRNDGGTDEVVGIEGVLGTAYEDIPGDDLENYLAAGAGDDILAGEGGSDELFGDEGNDYIYGGDGDDYIVGGAGVDILFGGSGRDVYAVDLIVDTIRDFGVRRYVERGRTWRGQRPGRVRVHRHRPDRPVWLGTRLPVPVPVPDRCQRLPVHAGTDRRRRQYHRDLGYSGPELGHRGGTVR